MQDTVRFGASLVLGFCGTILILSRLMALRWTLGRFELETASRKLSITVFVSVTRRVHQCANLLAALDHVTPCRLQDGFVVF